MSIYTNYNIQIDSLLTWFPVKNSARLKEPRMRMCTVKYNTNDQVFVIGNRIGRFIGQGLDNDDALESRNLVVAFTETGVNENEVFYTDFQVRLGRSVRDQRLIFQSNTITPFLINLRAAQEEDPELNDTAVSFQGVVTASRRRSDLIYLATRIFRRNTSEK